VSVAGDTIVTIDDTTSLLATFAKCLERSYLVSAEAKPRVSRLDSQLIAGRIFEGKITAFDSDLIA